MEPEIKHLLEENLALAKENNKMLKRLRGGQKWSSLGRLVHWILIIVATVWAYYYFSSYIEWFNKLKESLPEIGDMQNFKDQFSPPQ